MRVKICGVSDTATATEALHAGAWAIGIVFYEPSPRNAGIAAARAIVDEVGGEMGVIAVFRRPTREHLLAVTAQTGIQTAQIHGPVPAELPTDITVIPGISLHEAATIPGKSLLLVDNADPGSGEVVDWGLAAEVAAHRDVILAGGLTPANVESAIRTVRPYAVDVSSGVESSPGVKDLKKIREFIVRAQGAAVS